MHPDHTQEALRRGMAATLEAYEKKYDGDRDVFYWVLRLKQAEVDAAAAASIETVPVDLQKAVRAAHERVNRYFDNVRYAMLEPITQLWGTVVNAVRVAAGIDRTTSRQREVFAFPLDSIVRFFLAARDRMEVADALFHAFKPMPAPECQALAALFNVHVDVRLDADSVAKIVRLLDAEGPLSDEETQALTLLKNTGLVHAAFKGLRGMA